MFEINPQMVKTRSQTKLEENEQVPAKHFKDGDNDLAKALKESMDEMLAKQPPSTSDTVDPNVTKPKTEPVSLKTLFHSLKSEGFPLPRFYKTLRKVVELVESDDVDGSRMMLLYLHHHNPDSQKFVENVLTDKGVVDIITNHFVLWAADFSKEEDRAKVEEEVEEQLSIEVVELLRQYQVENYPLMMVVMLLEGQHQVMKVFTGVKNIPTLYQGLTETIFTFKSMLEEEHEGVENEDVAMEEDDVNEPNDTTPPPIPVLVQLQVGPCIHPVQFSPLQHLQDLLQYVACKTGLRVGQFSLTSAPGTDLTLIWNTITLQQVGMQGGTRVRLRIARK
jgi:hypothetical protein